jgi:hypothetical protein
MRPLAASPSLGSLLTRVAPALLACAVVGGLGCAPAWREAMDRADDARRRGDLVAAATDFQRACDLGAPPESRACEAADRLAGKATKAALADARRRCDALRPCLDALAEVRSLVVDDRQKAEVEGLLDDAAAGHVARCRAEPLASLDDALRQARCVGAYAADVGTRTHDRRVAQARAEVSRFLVDAARQLEAVRAYGAASAHATLARCVDGSAAAAALADDSRRRFREENAVPLRLRIAGLDAAARRTLCERIERTSAGVCAGDASSAALRTPSAVTLDGEVAIGRLRHTVTHEDRVAHYVDRVDRVPNGERLALERQLDLDHRALRRLDAEAKDARDDCQRAEAALLAADGCQGCPPRTRRDQACERAERSTGRYNEAASALNAKEDALASMPRVVDVPHTATHVYRESLHRWELPFTLAIDGPPLRDVVGTTDVERAGFSAAGILADPLEGPDEDRLRAAIVERALDAAVRAANTALVDAAARLRCGDRDAAARADCELAALWYRGADPIPQWLEQHASAVESPWPRAACAPLQ